MFRNRIAETVAAFLGKLPNSENENNEQKIDWDKLTSPGYTYAFKSFSSHEEKEVKESKESKDEPSFTFYALGCADNGVESQKAVAELMNKIASSDKKPDLIIFLGDNFTSHGVDYCHDTIFNTHFHSIYQSPELKVLNEIPCVVILGNHDSDMPNMNPAKIMAQIQHSYYEKTEENKPKFDMDKVQLFTPQNGSSNVVELNVDQFKKQKNKWNMPSRYFSMRFAKNKEMFFIDSNTYVKEYVEFVLNKDGNKNANKQTEWLEKAAKNSDTFKLLFLHHSLHTVGKRTICHDTTDYLSANDLALLKQAGIVGNYNEILREILYRQGLEFDAVFAAHDHSMYYHVDKTRKLCQIVAGGAGGPLQNRYNYDNYERTPCFLKDNGFVKVEIPSGSQLEMFLNFYTVGGYHLKFSHKSLAPIRPLREDKLAKLGELVITACDEYQDYLAKNPQLPWTFANKVLDVVWDDILNVDDLKNYFNRMDALDWETSVTYLKTALAKCAAAKSFPKWQEIFNKLLKNYQTSYDRFIVNGELILDKATRPISPENKESADSSTQKTTESTSKVRFFGLLGGSYSSTPRAESKISEKKNSLIETSSSVRTATEEGMVPSAPIPIPNRLEEKPEAKQPIEPVLLSESPLPTVTKFNTPNTSFSSLFSRIAESYFSTDQTLQTTGVHRSKISVTSTEELKKAPSHASFR